MERTGWGHRIVRFWSWRPQTYLQVWVLALTAFGGAELIAWAVLRTPFSALAIVIFGSTLSWQMYRRRHQGR